MTIDNNQGPLQRLKNGSIRIAIWERHSHQGKPFVNATISKVYKDKATGEFKHGRNFNDADLLKLQELIPEATQEMAKWRDYYNEMSKSQQQAPVKDMAAERDAVMKQARATAQNASEHVQDHTPDHEPER